MNFLLKIILLLLCIQVPSANALITATEKLQNSNNEARAINLGQRIKCPVCAGQSINGSNAELAVAMRLTIREQIKAGASDTEIKEFLVARYGNGILFEPPKRNIIWLIPAIILITAMAGYFITRKKAIN